MRAVGSSIAMTEEARCSVQQLASVLVRHPALQGDRPTTGPVGIDRRDVVHGISAPLRKSEEGFMADAVQRNSVHS